MSDYIVNKESRNKLAEYIKNKRMERGLGLNQLALKAGIQKTILSRLENGKILKINPFFLQQLAKSLNENYEDLYRIVGYLHNDSLNKTRLVAKKYVTLYKTVDQCLGIIDLLKDNGVYLIPVEDYEENRYVVNFNSTSMCGLQSSIPNESFVLVDPVSAINIEEFKNRLCLFTYKNRTYLRELEVNDQGIFLLIAYNKEVGDLIILDQNELKCEGVVVKTWSEKTW